MLAIIDAQKPIQNSFKYVDIKIILAIGKCLSNKPNSNLLHRVIPSSALILLILGIVALFIVMFVVVTIILLLLVLFTKFFIIFVDGFVNDGGAIVLILCIKLKVDVGYCIFCSNISAFVLKLIFKPFILDGTCNKYAETIGGLNTGGSFIFVGSIIVDFVYKNLQVLWTFQIFCLYRNYNLYFNCFELKFEIVYSQAKNTRSNVYICHRPKNATIQQISATTIFVGLVSR
ncbi:hypothetical protein DiNV_CH01M_ORF55 [Drosophila innubila nudivirus]|uniref:Uncharacterized protein n=1 Tax=Drosophila innubila nudivirus TaxID=2057187 RepID=A0A2H4UX97_9VIRU|nr:hypothetical protein DiNV_CH01M_ORF55 [Drosophila innubila nudivirus]ATZ81541.1 hypothetical protein DiNV_CH01M_ORF55 [Drosophila innubila nudivirus]